MLPIATLLVTLLYLVSGSVLSSPGVGSFDGWVLHTGAIAIAHITLRRPFSEGAVLILIIAYLADLLNSGPPGTYHIAATLVFFLSFALQRIASARFLLLLLGLFSIGVLSKVIFSDTFDAHFFWPFLIGVITTLIAGQRSGDHTLTSGFTLTFAAALSIDLILAGIYTLQYNKAVLGDAFGDRLWMSAIVSAALYIPYAWLLSLLERFLAQRGDRSVMIEN